MMAVDLLGSGQARTFSLIILLGVLKASLASGGDGPSVHHRRGVNWLNSRNSPPSFVARVEHTDQSEEMQMEAIRDAIWAIENLPDHRARYVKEQFDRKFPHNQDDASATWHCVISDTDKPPDIYVSPRDTTYLEFSLLPGPKYQYKAYYVLLFQTYGV